VHAFAVEPLQVDFPFARSLIVLRSQRTCKKTGRTTTESRYYLSSLPAQDYSAEHWLRWIRGHWGGVEIRNHWRRDAVMGEDGSRSRNANLLANLALVRSVLLGVVAQHCPNRSLPEVHEQLHSRPGQCLDLITNS
jgi:predicted transposase YbfD/YdcC